MNSPTNAVTSRVRRVNICSESEIICLCDSSASQFSSQYSLCHRKKRIPPRVRQKSTFRRRQVPTILRKQVWWTEPVVLTFGVSWHHSQLTDNKKLNSQPRSILRPRSQLPKRVWWKSPLVEVRPQQKVSVRSAVGNNVGKLVRKAIKKMTKKRLLKPLCKLASKTPIQTTSKILCKCCKAQNICKKCQVQRQTENFALR